MKHSDMICHILSQWRHNERDGVSNHQRTNCLFKRLFRCRSKKTSKPRVTGLCDGNAPVTKKMFPLDDVIMVSKYHLYNEIYVML